MTWGRRFESSGDAVGGESTLEMTLPGTVGLTCGAAASVAS